MTGRTEGTPRWVKYILGDLVPAFGGMATFCEDPDNLLDLPDAREALRAGGMSIGDWDGLPTSLVPYKHLADDEMPLLVVEVGAPRHIVESCLHDYRWESVSIGEMLPKFAHEVVRTVPPSYWDALFALHDEVRSPRSAQDTAVLIARAVYGVDPEHLTYGNGWLRTLVRIAAGDETLPPLLARHVRTLSIPSPTFTNEELEEALSSGTSARSLLEKAVAAHPGILEGAAPTDQLLYTTVEQATRPVKPVDDASSLIRAWEEAKNTPQSVLAFGLRYAEALADGHVAEHAQETLNEEFEAWIMANYGVVMSAANPALLRLPTLVSTLDLETDSGKLLLVVVDALGLEAWRAVQERWQADKLISGATTRVALAVLPTVTSLSRRAIFEGKPPSQFGPERHSQRLERKLWSARFGDDGCYFTVDEEIGLCDAIAQGKSRICVLDVSWDKRGHSIDPRTDSVVDAARVWAGKTPLRAMISAALQAGYRVVITADHGQVACCGKERLQVGVLSEERSKRVMLFKDKTASQHYEKAWATYFKPTGISSDLYPLFARGYSSFDTPGVPTVSHGGMSIEEALVPVAEVTA